jgi:hypothetical protein
MIVAMLVYYIVVLQTSPTDLPHRRRPGEIALLTPHT